MKIHSARLISIQQPLPEVALELGVDSPEGLTAWIARVSNPKGQSKADISGLIGYCMKHGHWSILEHINVTFEVTTTRDIMAQMTRHWSMRFQIFSGRYSDQNSLGELYEIPEMRGRHPSNRQASIDDFKLPPELLLRVSDHLKSSKRLYDDLIAAGVAPECARRILPESTVTKVYVTGNLRDFYHYVTARTYEGAQKEHRKVAQSIKEILMAQFPIVSKAAGWNYV